MDLFAGSNRSVVARYLAGEVSLDSAASELAELWKELALAEGSAKQRMRSRLPGEAYELACKANDLKFFDPKTGLRVPSRPLRSRA